jgi:hypothetical protein
MTTYGYIQLKYPSDRYEPDIHKVKNAMNRINAADREKTVAMNLKQMKQHLAA